MNGNATNSGTIGAREATVITAGNIVNQAGGAIQGGSVNLAAREDLSNLVSSIKGGKVVLSAGRDIALTSTSASENYGSSWGVPDRRGARGCRQPLMRAGRDLTLTAAQVASGCAPASRAGHRPGYAHESHGDPHRARLAQSS